MKPIVTIILTHKVMDSSTSQFTSVTAVFSAKLPTNVVATIGHSLWLDVWEDNHLYELKVAEVNHFLSERKVWQQEIVANAELEAPQTAPDDGSLATLVRNEKDEIARNVATRLLDQGFSMVVVPNTDHQIGNPKKRWACLR